MWRLDLLWHKGAFLALFLLVPAVAQKEGTLLWASAGGGWRAMSACIGYANAFRQAGLFNENSTEFDALSTISGASWFLVQIFYSNEFYEQAVLSETPEELGDFITTWFETWADLNTDVSDEAKQTCSRLRGAMAEECELASNFEFDWAAIIQDMLEAAAASYGDTSFVETMATAENRIGPMSETDMLNLIALMPNSRIRSENNKASTAVYLGYENNLLAVPVSATYTVDESGAGWTYGTQDLTAELQTYTDATATTFRWSDWFAFKLFYPGTGGTVTIDSSEVGIVEGTESEAFREPFGGPESTNVAIIAAASSATAGYAGPLMPSVYAQSYRNMLDGMTSDKMAIWKKFLMIFFVSLAAGALVHFGIRYWKQKRKGSSNKSNAADKRDETKNATSDGANSENNDDGEALKDISNENPKSCCAKCRTCCVRITPCCCCGFVFAIMSIFVSFGSVLIPVAFNKGLDFVYEGTYLDKVSICSQHPNPCGTQDAQFSDGYYIDPPSLSVNLGHHMQKNGVNNDQPLKVIITNTVTLAAWDTPLNIDQFLTYFDTEFNQGIPPGGFLWRQDAKAPHRSPRIFEEYLDREGLNSLLVSIPDSNMTTASFRATTIDNPSVGVVAGQMVDVLLLNLNFDITTMLIGKSKIGNHTQLMADMVNHVAFNEELIERVRSFVYGDEE